EGDGSSWKQLCYLIDAAVKDKAEKPSRKLSAAMHLLQVQNKLLHHEIDSLRSALTTKKKHQKKSKSLDLQQRKEYHGGVVYWSPRKVRKARARESVKQMEKEAEKLQKAETKQLKAAATLYKKKMAEEAKAVQRMAKEAREKDRAAAAAEATASKAQKQQEKDAANTVKAVQLSQRGKRSASQQKNPQKSK
ncbi:hypothetical protein EJ02DRAFT_344354, partial [Clathrospora elynae]